MASSGENRWPSAGRNRWPLRLRSARFAGGARDFQRLSDRPADVAHDAQPAPRSPSALDRAGLCSNCSTLDGTHLPATSKPRSTQAPTLGPRPDRGEATSRAHSDASPDVRTQGCGADQDPPPPPRRRPWLRLAGPRAAAAARAHRGSARSRRSRFGSTGRRLGSTLQGRSVAKSTVCTFVVRTSAIDRAPPIYSRSCDGFASDPKPTRTRRRTKRPDHHCVIGLSLRYTGAASPSSSDDETPR